MELCSQHAGVDGLSLCSLCGGSSRLSLSSIDRSIAHVLFLLSHGSVIPRQECAKLLSTYLWLSIWGVLDLESYDKAAMNIYKSLSIACGTAVWPSMVTLLLYVTTC